MEKTQVKVNFLDKERMKAITIGLNIFVLGIITVIIGAKQVTVLEGTSTASDATQISRLFIMTLTTLLMGLNIIQLPRHSKR